MIGIGGNIGTGKTTVADLFREWGAAVISADEVGWELLPEIAPALKKKFGEEIMCRSGCMIDRKRLRALVFSDRSALAYLNRVSHPRLKKKIMARVEALKSGFIVIDAALLFDWPEILALCDYRILVTARPGRMRARAAAKGIEPGLFSMIRSVQGDNETMAAKADFVIRNDGTLADLRGELRAVYERIKNDR